MTDFCDASQDAQQMKLRAGKPATSFSKKSNPYLTSSKGSFL
jgi:hypothetical protein